MRIHLPLYPTSKLQMLKKLLLRSRSSAEKHATPLCCAEQFICTSDLCPPLPHTCVLGVCRSSWLDSAEYGALRQSGLVASHYLFQMCGAICHKTGRPRFPFSLGLVSLFSGASLLPVWLLGPGSGPTKGFLKWRSWGWGCSGPSAAGLWGPSIINGATSAGDSSDIQPWPEVCFWTQLPGLAKKINK